MPIKENENDTKKGNVEPNLNFACNYFTNAGQPCGTDMGAIAYIEDVHRHPRIDYSTRKSGDIHRHAEIF
jgi:hypothetical protein